MEQRHSHRTRSGAKHQCQCWGRRGAGGTADKGRAIGPPDGAGFPGHGQGKGSWFRSGGASLDLPTNGGTTALGGVPRRGIRPGEPGRENRPGEGSLFTESPGSKLCHRAGGCFLKLWKEQRNTESWGRCQTQSLLPGECRGGEKHSAYGKPRVFHAACRRERQPPRHSMPFRFLSVPSGAFRGHDWGPSSLALHGHQPWAPWELQHVWRGAEMGGGGGQTWPVGKGTDSAWRAQGGLPGGIGR